MIPRNPDNGSLERVNSFGTEFVMIQAFLGDEKASKIEVVQPEIKYEAFVNAYTNALLMCLQGLVSPATLGIDVGKMSSAEAQREKKDVTGNTRNTITTALEKALPELIEAVLKTYDNIQGKAPRNYAASVSFGEYGAPDFDSRVETVGKAGTYGIMSVETQVNELWGSSKDEEWKAGEVRRIKSEKGLLEADDPLPKTLDNSEIEKRYELEQKLRRLENNVRKAKRKVEGFSDPDNVKKANKELREAQKKVREFIDQVNEEYGKIILKRDYGREKIYSENRVDISEKSDIIELEEVKQLEQAKKRDHKIEITDVAIDKITSSDIPIYTDEQNKMIDRIHKQVLQLSKDNNDSNETAILFDLDSGEKEMMYGSENSVNIFDNPNALMMSNFIVNDKNNSTLESTRNGAEN